MVLGHSFLFRKAAIIGVGLIGGSLGKAMKKKQLAREICGVSRRKEALEEAVKSGSIDHGTHDIKKAVVNADLVVLAAPVNTVSAMFELIAPHLRRGCVVTDVGSVKSSITASALSALPNPSFFVGSHPIAGSEKRGVEHSSAELFEGALCILTPVEQTHRAAVDRVKRLWTAVGAVVKVMPPSDHDKALSYVSHLPHLLAYALMNSIPDQYAGIGAQGLKDMTRIASSSPEVWNDICLANSKNIVKAIDEFTAVLSVLRRAVMEFDEKTLVNEFKKANLKRGKF